MSNTLYNMLQANRIISIKVFEKLVELKGLQCVIKEPVTQGSIFGKEDLVDYDEFVKKERKLLLFGIFTESSMGGIEYDTFMDNCFALTLYKDRIPLQSIIEVNFCGRYMSFKVDDHKNLYPTLCEQTFIKNLLVPAT